MKILSYMIWICMTVVLLFINKSTESLERGAHFKRGVMYYLSLWATLLFLLLSCSNKSVPDLTLDSPNRPLMKPLEGGSFLMGDLTDTYTKEDYLEHPESMSPDVPIHKVELSPFYIGETEVSGKQYEAVMGNDSTKIWRIKGWHLSRPAQVNWYDAVRYCNALSILEGRKPCYNTITWRCNFRANGYRLTTDAEWEYACRGGTSSYYFWNPHDSLYIFMSPAKLTNGDNSYYTSLFHPDSAVLYSWIYLNSGDSSHPVGELLPNPFGLYDMIGNADEWCNDVYDTDYYLRSPLKNPKGAKRSKFSYIPFMIHARVVRGYDALNREYPNDAVYASSHRSSHYAHMGLLGIRLALNKPVVDN